MSQVASPERPGMFKQAAEAVKDLFRHERVTILDEHGNYVEKVIKPEPLVNPIKLLCMLTWKNWLFFLVGLAPGPPLGIVIAHQFVQVLWRVQDRHFNFDHAHAFFRSLGAAIFGVAGDYYGRKWPMVINMFIIGALQLGTAYAPNYHAFLGIRSLFGIGMGGVWGCAIAMALESVPLRLVVDVSIAPRGGADGFKDLFYIGAGASFFVGLVRMCFPESEQFRRAKEQGQKGGHTKQFMKEAGVVVKTQWHRIIYACILMALFNFFSHTTQDAYPTFLQSGKGFSQQDASRGTIIAKTGATVGGAFVAGSFFLQFMVQGAWGVIPVHLNELSPPAFRASFPGIAYQIGNMISSPAAEMVTGISEKNFITHNGKRVEGNIRSYYGIATAIIAILLAFWTAVGKEAKGSHFENAVAGHGVVDTNAPKADIETASTASNEKGDQPVHQEKA
ncbi:transporter [Rhizoctonia solani]|uniref:Transporter n=1 Tax=Rhizoctonia solani TaxID=456999 RepID=A0A8H7IHP5_9AGAM|nr:transporter [Rhizoctonia solani]